MAYDPGCFQYLFLSSLLFRSLNDVITLRSIKNPFCVIASPESIAPDGFMAQHSNVLMIYSHMNKSVGILTLKCLLYSTPFLIYFLEYYLLS